MATLNFLGSKLQSFKDDGTVNASGTVEFFAVGGTFSTYVSSYTSSALTTANSNVVTLDSAGRADCWLNTDADVRIRDSSGTIIDTQLNINPAASTTSANDNLVLNPSFENDSNSDLVPDDWSVTTYTGGTATIDTGDRNHGANSMKFVSVGNGGGTITSTSFFPVAAGSTLYWGFDLKSTADVRNLVQLLWYDASQVALGSPSTDLYDDSTTNPTSWTRKVGSVAVPATAYYAKFKVFGAHSSDATSGTVRIDNIVLSPASTPSHNVTFTGTNTFTPAQYFTAGIGPSYLNNYSLSAAVASNALTLTLAGYDGTALSSTNKAQFMFRNATAATGTSAVVDASANLTLTISSGSTLGATSGTPFRLWWGIVNDAGTLRLAVRNCSTSPPLSVTYTTIYSIGDNVLVSSTAEGGAGAADSAGVWYSGTGVTSKAIRILGYTEHSLTTAGTWDEVPDVIQLWQTGMKLPGEVTQSISSVSRSFSTGTTVMPADNTTPQNTEGDQYAAITLTPQSTMNLLRFKIQTHAACSAANLVFSAAIFKDSDASAIAAFMHQMTAADIGINFHGEYTQLAASTSSATYKLRCGASSASTLTYNGAAGANIFNGVSNASFSCEEIIG